jgi:hypothetical protein
MEFQSTSLQTLSDGLPHFLGFLLRLAVRDDIIGVPLKWHLRIVHRQPSVVTLTFKKQGEDTVMKLVHSGIPDTDAGRGHEKGWNCRLDIFPAQFGNGWRKE